MTDTTPPMIGTDEAAQRLRVSRATITRWAQSGKITPLHKAAGERGAYVFAEDEIERERKARGR